VTDAPLNMLWPLSIAVMSAGGWPARASCAQLHWLCWNRFAPAHRRRRRHVEACQRHGPLSRVVATRKARKAPGWGTCTAVCTRDLLRRDINRGATRGDWWGFWGQRGRSAGTERRSRPDACRNAWMPGPFPRACSTAVLRADSAPPSIHREVRWGRQAVTASLTEVGPPPSIVPTAGSSL
jgi:hypothetical protein